MTVRASSAELKTFSRFVVTVFAVMTVTGLVAMALAIGTVGVLSRKPFAVVVAVFLLIGLRYAVLAGVLATLGFVVLDVVQRWPIARQYGVPLIFGANQQIQLTVDRDRDEALSCIEARIRDLDWIDASSVRRLGATILAVTQNPWAGWGEKLRISANDEGRRTQLTIASSPPVRPSLQPAIVDYGKGLKNVSALRDAVTEWLPRR